MEFVMIAINPKTDIATPSTQKLQFWIAWYFSMSKWPHFAVFRTEIVSETVSEAVPFSISSIVEFMTNTAESQWGIEKLRVFKMEALFAHNIFGSVTYKERGTPAVNKILNLKNTGQLGEYYGLPVH